MKTIFLIATLTTIVFVGCKNQNSEDKKLQTTDNKQVVSSDLKIDTQKSYIKWTGSMIGLYSHFGTLNFKQGIVSISDDQVVGGKFVVDMNTIAPTDDNYKMSPKEKLVEHLKSDDFFSVSQYPEASLEIVKSEKDFIWANLTIRGITKEEKITDVKVEKNANGYILSGKLTFDRQKYNVSYKSSMKDKVLSDNIELEVYLFTN